jgi:hypothetical protein
MSRTVLELRKCTDTVLNLALYVDIQSKHALICILLTCCCIIPMCRDACVRMSGRVPRDVEGAKPGATSTAALLIRAR